MKRISNNLLLLICLAWLKANCLYASSGIAITEIPSWVKKINYTEHESKDIDVNDGIYLILLDQQVNVPAQLAYKHSIVKIINETGVQNGSQVMVLFDPSFQQIIFHHIYIKRDGKKTDVMKPSKFSIVKQESDLSRFVYNGTHTALYILEDVRIGDEIEYDYTLKGFNPVFNGKYFNAFYFNGRSAIGTIYYSVLMAQNRHLYTREFNNAPHYTSSWLNDLHMQRYEWERDKSEAVAEDNYEPSWYDPYAKVQVSEMNSWDEVVNWANAVYADVTTITPSLKATTDAWRKGSKNDDYYAQKCVRFVQDEIRYMGIEMSVYSHKPHTPEKVFNQRYGDCKDKSLLLCALLNAQHISAAPVYISTHYRGHLDEQLPSPLAFDHCVCVVKLNNTELWIDPTISLQREGIYTLYIPNYEKGLVIKPGVGDLSIIPKRDPGDMKIKEKFTLFNVSQDGFLNVTSDFTGAQADFVRNEYQSSTHDVWQKSCLDFYSRSYDSVFTDLPLIFNDDQVNNHVTMVESYRIKHAWLKEKIDGGKYYFQLNPQIIKDKLVPLPKNSRTSPMSIIFPCYVDYTIEAVMPDDWKVPTVSKIVNNEAFAFSFNSYNEKNIVKYKYTYNALMNDIPVQQIKTYNRDIDSVYQHLGYQLTWNKAMLENTGLGSYRFNFVFFIITLVALGIYAYAGTKIYRASLESLAQPSHTTISGWMILPLLGLFASIIRIFVHFNDANYFNEDYLNELKTNIATASIHFDLWFIYEIVANLFMVSFALLCIICFLKKRDITPKLMIYFLLCMVAINFLDVTFKALAGYKIDSSDTSGVLRLLLAAGIWVPFFLKSKRVKETFIVPYGGFRKAATESVRVETVAESANEKVEL